MADQITQVLGIVAMSNKGEYNSQTDYEKLNVVTYNGSSYCAKQNCKGKLPTDPDYWQLLAEKGEQGDIGPQGPKPVKGVDYYTEEDKSEFSTEIYNDVHDEVSEQVGSLVSATPLAASSTSEMTDTTRIYVNTSDGYWYYYSGSSWVRGAVYQATEDSDTVEKLSNIVENINSIEFAKTNNSNATWYHGGLNYVSGANLANNAYIRSWFIYARAGSKLNVDNGYKFTVCRYSTPNETDFIDGKSATITGEYVVPSNCYLRIAIAKSDDTEQTDFSIVSHFKNNILSYEQSNIVDLSNQDLWELGGISSTNGEKTSSTYRVRLKNYLSDFADGFCLLDDYVGYLIAYDENNTYVGYWVGNGFDKASGQEITSSFDIKTLREEYPSYKFLVTLRTPSQGVITTTDVIYKKCVFNMNINSLFKANKTDYVIDDYIKIPQYNIINDNINDYYALWETFVSDGYATKSLLATINGKPMYSYTFTNNNKYIIDINGTQQISSSENLYDKKNILIVSGLHGNEKGAPLYLYNLMTLLVYNKSFNNIFSKYNWYIIPIANPTGYDADTRNNYQNININRDFGDFITIEAQVIRTLLNSKHFEYAFDLHQSFAGASSDNRPTICGYVSLPYNESPSKVSEVFNNIMPSAMKCQSFLCDMYFIDNTNQTFFPWDGTNNTTLRNYAKNYSDYSLCYETSRNCYYYSKSTDPYNDAALIVGNTFTINTILDLIK